MAATLTGMRMRLDIAMVLARLCCVGELEDAHSNSQLQVRSSWFRKFSLLRRSSCKDCQHLVTLRQQAAAAPNVEELCGPLLRGCHVMCFNWWLYNIAQRLYESESCTVQVSCNVKCSVEVLTAMAESTSKLQRPVLTSDETWQPASHASITQK